MKKLNIRNVVKEIARDAMIDPNEEFYVKVETALCSQINVEFLEKIRSEMIKKTPSKDKATNKALNLGSQAV
jgi:hypothetical protein